MHFKVIPGTPTLFILTSPGAAVRESGLRAGGAAVAEGAHYSSL